MLHGGSQARLLCMLTVLDASTVTSLLLWQDSLTSAIVFSSGLLFLFLISYGGYTLLTLFSYIALLQLAVCFVFLNGTKLVMQLKGDKSRAETTTTTTSTNSNSDEPVDYLTEQMCALWQPVLRLHVNRSLSYITNIIRCVDNVKTAKVCLVLLCTSLIGRLFDGLTCLAFGKHALM